MIGSLTIAAISGVSAGIFFAVIIIISCGLCVRLGIHQKCANWAVEFFSFRNKQDTDFEITAGQSPEQELNKLQEVSFDNTAVSTDSTSTITNDDFADNPIMLQLSLSFDFYVNKLYVNIICALHVPSRWHKRSPKTQIRFQLLPDIDSIFNTAVVTGGNQPIFNESFEFIGYEARDLADITMRVGIYLFDAFSKAKLLGYTCVHFQDIEWDPTEVNILWRSLRLPEMRERTSSFLNGRQLHLSLRYQARSDRISVTVLKGTNLAGTSRMKIIAPYILVMLSLEGKILAKEQTKRKRTTNPVWNKGFLFDIDPSKLQDYVITIRVMNYDRLLSNESIGEVVISSQAKGTGREHWDEMMKVRNINRETAMSHQLS